MTRAYEETLTLLPRVLLFTRVNVAAVATVTTSIVTVCDHSDPGARARRADYR